MKNFPVEIKGKTYWISRSVSVTLIVFVITETETFLLANKRGPKTPDFQGYWNIPCGYLDYNETAEEAAVRELKEETGIEVYDCFLSLDGINSSPKENNQNVNIRYVTIGSKELLSKEFVFDPEEVEKVKWINVNDIDNYNWAFNHLEILKNTIYNRNISIKKKIEQNSIDIDNNIIDMVNENFWDLTNK